MLVEIIKSSKIVEVSKQRGKPGVDGLNGWTPLLAVVENGEKRVLKVVDWVRNFDVLNAVTFNGQAITNNGQTVTYSGA